MAADDMRLALPHWHELRDLVLITLVDERRPIRRYELAERTVSAGRWPRVLREQRPLATKPTHPTHLAERVNATIGQMHRDGLLDRPRRGYYALSAAGRRSARELSRERSRRRSRIPVGLPRLAASTSSERGVYGEVAASAMPAWALRMPVGRWQPFEPVTAPKTRAPDPFTWDADDKDAETQQHAEVLIRLYDVLRDAGIDAVRGTTRPACDLAFRTRGGMTIVEAKSLPKGSDEHQMRMGLGQVLQYRAELSGHVRGRIRPIVAVPRAPDRAPTWRRACGAAGVTLLVVGPATRRLRQALIG